MAMFIALIVVTGTSGSTRSPCAGRCKGRRRRAIAEPDAVTQDGKAGEQDTRIELGDGA